MRAIRSLPFLTVGSFAHSVGVLVGGTALAHAIIAVTLPIATRLYSPQDFSVLALFTALVSILSVAACLRFDVAVSIPQDDNEAVNVLALAAFFAIATTLLVAIVLLLGAGPILGWLNEPALDAYIWLLPVAVLLASLYSVLQFWFIRRKAFRGISTNRIAQAAAASGAQIGFGFLNLAPLGLLLGHAINVGAGCVGLGWRFMKADRHLLAAISIPTMRQAFASHSRFPKFSALEAISNSASIYLPIVLITSLAVGPEAGYVILAMQVMQAPMSLIGAAIAQVYLSRAPEEFRAGALAGFTASIFGGLIRTGVGPLLFAGIVAPPVFAILFGAVWRPAGELVVWMTPWFIMQFLSTPIAMALHVTSNQKAALLLQVAGLIIRAGAVLLAYQTAPHFLTEAYALSGFVFYFAYMAVVLAVVGVDIRAALSAVRASLPILLAWIAAGALAAWAAVVLGRLVAA